MKRAQMMHLVSFGPLVSFFFFFFFCLINTNLDTTNVFKSFREAVVEETCYKMP